MKRDPYRYFRVEAGELVEGLTAGMLLMEKGGDEASTIDHMLRLTHTLKGTARIVKRADIADSAHAMEDVLIAARDNHQAVPVGQLFLLLDEIVGQLRSLDPPLAAPSGQGARTLTVDDSLQSVRLEVRHLDVLLEGVAAAGVQLSSLSLCVETAARARRQMSLLMRMLETPGGQPTATASARVRQAAEGLQEMLEEMHRGLSSGVADMQDEMTQVQEHANGLRLMPARVLFSSLARAIRDAGEAVRKGIDFESAGGDLRLDGHVLAALRDALLHVVRNSVAHGIESAEERVALGKPARGQLRLEVERRGRRMAFICSDDGRGIDVDGVRNAAVQSGVLSQSEADTLGADEVHHLVFRAGLSTARALSQLSGRGVGLDVVRDAVARLKGDVTLDSVNGAGTTITLTVPISMTSMTTLRIDVGGTPVAIPLDAVIMVVRVSPGSIRHSSEGASIIHDGRALPYAPLSRLLTGREERLAETADGTVTAVILKGAAGHAAIGVSRLLGTAEAVTRPLPEIAGASMLVAGANFDADWNPRLLLDPNGLVEIICGQRATVPAPLSRQTLPVLVIDDSMTTRMLEQSILESAGYEVDLAVSGEQALVMAKQRRYAVFVCDVEMPGMDGFTFMERVREDPTLREVPGILVTSRASPEDLARSVEVGARAHLVKNEFNEARLLKIVRDLVA